MGLFSAELFAKINSWTRKGKLSSDEGDTQDDKDSNKMTKEKTKNRKPAVGKISTTINNKFKKYDGELEEMEKLGVGSQIISSKKKVVESIRSDLKKRIDNYNQAIVTCEKRLDNYEELLSQDDVTRFKLKKVSDIKQFLNIKKNQALKCLTECRIEANKALIDRANNRASKRLITAKVKVENVENRKGVVFSSNCNNSDVVNGNKVKLCFDIVNGVVQLYDKDESSSLFDRLLECDCLSDEDKSVIGKIFRDYPSTVLHIPLKYLSNLSRKNICLNTNDKSKVNLLKYIKEIAEEGFEVASSTGRSLQVKSKRDFKVMKEKNIYDFAQYMNRKVTNKLKKHTIQKYAGVPDRDIAKGGVFTFNPMREDKSENLSHHMRSSFHRSIYEKRNNVFNKLKNHVETKIARNERKQELAKKEIKDLKSYLENVKKQRENDGVIGKALKIADIITTNLNISAKQFFLKNNEKIFTKLSRSKIDKMICQDEKYREPLTKCGTVRFNGYKFNVKDGAVDFSGPNADLIINKLSNSTMCYHGNGDRELSALVKIFVDYPRTLSTMDSSYLKKFTYICLNEYLGDNFIGSGLEYICYLAEAGYDLRKKQGQKIDKYDLEDLEQLKNKPFILYSDYKQKQLERRRKAQEAKEKRMKKTKMSKPTVVFKLESQNDNGIMKYYDPNYELVPNINIGGYKNIENSERGDLQLPMII